jgi:hypothetical protein
MANQVLGVGFTFVDLGKNVAEVIMALVDLEM